MSTFLFGHSGCRSFRRNLRKQTGKNLDTDRRIGSSSGGSVMPCWCIRESCNNRRQKPSNFRRRLKVSGRRRCRTTLRWYGVSVLGRWKPPTFDNCRQRRHFFHHDWVDANFVGRHWESPFRCWASLSCRSRGRRSRPTRGRWRRWRASFNVNKYFYNSQKLGHFVTERSFYFVCKTI